MFSQRAHRFCTQKGGIDLSTDAWNEAEFGTFQTCLDKYDTTFKMFIQQSAAFEKDLKSAEAMGADRHAPYKW